MPVASISWPAPGVVYTVAGARFYPFDVAAGGPSNSITDYTVFDVQATSFFSGSPVIALVLLAVGTYSVQTVIQVSTKTGTFAGLQLGLSATGGLVDFQQFIGRTGSAWPDSWYNAPGLPNRPLVFRDELVLVRAGEPPVSITPDVVPIGAGDIRCFTTMNATQLSPISL